MFACYNEDSMVKMMLIKRVAVVVVVADVVFSYIFLF